VTPARLALAAVSVLAGILLWLAVVPWVGQPTSNVGVGQAGDFDPPQAAWSVPLAIAPPPPPSAITETLTRPVFNESRRPDE